MKWWKIVNALFVVFFALALGAAASRKSFFQTSLEYHTALLLFGILLGSLLFSSIHKRQKPCYLSSYVTVSFLLTASFAYSMRAGEFNVMSPVFYLLSLGPVFSLYNRFEALRFLEDFWVTLLSAVGFWVILLKFSSLGTMALLLAVNTSLLIAVLSYALMEEEEMGEEEGIAEFPAPSLAISTPGFLSDISDIFARSFIMLFGVLLLVLVSKRYFPESVFAAVEPRSLVMVMAVLAILALYGKISAKGGEQ